MERYDRFTDTFSIRLVMIFSPRSWVMFWASLSRVWAGVREGLRAPWAEKWSNSGQTLQRLAHLTLLARSPARTVGRSLSPLTGSISSWRTRIWTLARICGAEFVNSGRGKFKWCPVLPFILIMTEWFLISYLRFRTDSAGDLADWRSWAAGISSSLRFTFQATDLLSDFNNYIEW